MDGRRTVTQEELNPSVDRFVARVAASTGYVRAAPRAPRHVGNGIRHGGEDAAVHRFAGSVEHWGIADGVSVAVPAEIHPIIPEAHLC